MAGLYSSAILGRGILGAIICVIVGVIFARRSGYAQHAAPHVGRMLNSHREPTPPSPAIAARGLSPGQAAGAERRRYLRLVILGAVVIGAMFTATMGAVIWQLRQNAITDATAEIEKLDRALAELIERSLQSCDLVIASIVDDLAGDRPVTADELRRSTTSLAFHQALRQKLAALPQADAISVIGSNGDILSLTRGYPIQPPINVADRDYFVALRDHPDLQRYISEPVQNRGTGAWTIYLARRINGPHGSLAGLVLAALQLNYFEDLYRDVNPGTGSVIGLYRNDGKLLARYPEAHAVTGRALAQSQSFADIAHNGGAALVWTTSGVLQDRIAAAERSLRDYPLITTVARSETAMLATWRSQALAVAASAAVVTLAIGFVAWLLYRQFVASELVAAAGSRADEESEARQEAQRAVAQAEATRRELERSEARFRDIAEVAADLIWETDRQHRFRQFTGDRSNGQLNDLSADAIGKTRWEIAGADPENDEHWRQHRADLDAHRPFRQFRFARRAPDGTIKHVSVSGKPVFDENGEFWGYRGTATNESAVVEAEQRALRSDVLLREAVDSISEGFVIYDQEDHLVLCNEAYRCLYPETAATKVPGARFEDILRLGISNDAESTGAGGRGEEWLERRMREHREPGAPFESRLRDGRWVLVSERRMASGGVAGLRIDITALKKVQASLRKSQAQLNLAQRVSNTGSMARDFQSEQTVWSDELLRICGLKPGEAPSSLAGFLALVHPDDRARVEAAIAFGENGARRPDLQYRIVRPDGTVRWVHREIEVVVDAAGKPASVISTFKDITDQRAAEEHRAALEQQLRHSQKLEALGTLAGGIAHDLNNTLVPILALSKMALKTLPPDHKVRKDLGIIAQACERARDLVRQILTFSRKQELVKERIDLAAVARETLQMLRASLPTTIRLTAEIAEVPPMLGDAGQLQQVIVNLIANAAQAIGERSGSIAVGLSASKAEPSAATQIRLTVADSGCGIPEQDLARIFEPFFTTKPVGEGTGLGLAVVHGIVTGHGGSIGVSSAPGEGTQFSILLPPLKGDDEARAFDRTAA